MHARLHALGNLDLVQAQSAARAGDQHGLSRPEAGNAQRRAHAGADGADRQRGRRHVESIGNADGVARRHAGEFGVPASALLAQHAAVAAEVLTAAQTMAADAAEQALIDHDAFAHALARDVSAHRRDLAGDLVAQNPAGTAARNPAGAREHIVIADAGRMDAHQHVVRAGFGTIDLGQLEHLRTAEGAERYRLHRNHRHRRPENAAAPSL